MLVLERGQEKTQKIDYLDLLKILPFGSGWLLLDKAEIVADGSKIIGTFTYLPWGNFRDHFSMKKDYPKLMPGVLHPEIVNQLAACFCQDKGFCQEHPEFDGKLFVLTDIMDYKFRGVVQVGDVLTIEVCRPEVRRNFITYSGEARNQNGQLLALGSLRATAIDRPD